MVNVLKLDEPAFIVLPDAVPLKVTVPELCVKVPEFVQLPPIERLPLVEMNVLPVELLTLPVTVTLPVPKLVVPPELERLPATERIFED